MIVTLDEMKQYLRVDYPDDDGILTELLSAAQKLCMDVARTDDAVASFPLAQPAQTRINTGLFKKSKDN